MPDNINPKDLDGVTPLHQAAKGGHLQICRAIIEKLVDKNPKCNVGMTPLHYAAERGRVGVYQLIIKHVGDKNPKNDAGLTPIDISDGHKNIARIFRQFS